MIRIFRRLWWFLWGARASTCPDCGYKGAIKWSPFKKVMQCHNCGIIITLDKAIKAVWIRELERPSLFRKEDKP